MLRPSIGNNPPTRVRLLAAALLATTLTGCTLPDRVRAEGRYDRGVVYVLPGIEGRSFLNRNIVLGLDEGGVASAIELYDWTVGVPGSFMINLAYLERNKRQALDLAERITDYRRTHPDAPMHIVSISGGAGIAALALAALPPDVQLDQVYLLAAALSPTFDLSPALEHVRESMVAFYSEEDVGLLRVGTSLFGGVDREFGSSAGAVGFERPPGLAREAAQLYRQRLRQVRWTEALERYGADGTHLGWASRQFAREYIAPLIVENEIRRMLDRPLLPEPESQPEEPPAIAP